MNKKGFNDKNLTGSYKSVSMQKFKPNKIQISDKAIRHSLDPDTIIASSMSMDVMGLKQEELIDGVKIEAKD